MASGQALVFVPLPLTSVRAGNPPIHSPVIAPGNSRTAYAGTAEPGPLRASTANHELGSFC
jgi:hypothetical protein